MVLKGNKVQKSVHLDCELYRRLKIALAMDDMKFSQWVAEQAERYVQVRLRGLLSGDAL